MINIMLSRFLGHWSSCHETASNRDGPLPLRGAGCSRDSERRRVALGLGPAGGSGVLPALGFLCRRVWVLDRPSRRALDAGGGLPPRDGDPAGWLRAGLRLRLVRSA